MRHFVWVVLAVLGALIFVGGAVGAAWLGHRMLHARSGGVPVVYVPSAHTVEPWAGDFSGHAEQEPDTTAPKPPAEVKRAIPVYGAGFLSGCSTRDLDAIRSRIHEAIGIAAPLYNAGDVAGSYHAYDAAAEAIALSYGDRCKGPAKALEQSRHHATARASLPEQAWTMRDTFDGILEVIDRRGTEL